MAITYLDEQPTSKITYLDKPKGKSLKRGERSLIGNIFERPGSAVRSGLMNIGKEGGFVKGYQSGANVPEEVPTFQESALKEYYGEGKPSLAKTVGGFGVSAAGMAGDILTNPADITALMTGAKPVRDVVGLTKLGGVVGATKVGKSLKAVATTPITKEVIAKPFVKAGEAIGKVARIPETVGKGTVRALIPYESVTERGLAKGFAPMLKPEYYGERIPQDTMKKGVNFFTDARKVAGEEISNIIKTKYTNTYVDSKLLQGEAKNILGKGISIKDLDISPAQMKLLSRETTKILGVKKPISVTDLWEMRKGLDKVIYDTGFSWKPDATKYLQKLRNILNKPIRNAGDDIAQSFNKYINVENTSDEIGKSFAGIVNKQTGEVSSPKFANFIQNLMSDNPRMTEVRNLISEINPQLAEELFNVAGAKRLGIPIKDPLQGGFFQASIYPLKRALHPKNIATVASKVQGVGEAVGKTLGKFQKKPVSLKARIP